MSLDGIEGEWLSFIQGEVDKPYFHKLKEFLKQERKTKTIFPSEKEVFTAFRLTPFEKVKVVVLGQDPYHGSGQAHGLAFSVKQGNKIPPSLRNIFKELQNDLGVPKPMSGELTDWAEQGVFLINTILTVEQKKAGSHRGKGWETFTDEAIELISKKKERVVFLLWGAFAHKKDRLIDSGKHLILKAPHPAAEVYAGGKAGFFGHKPFSKANNFLDEPVDWSL